MPAKVDAWKIGDPFLDRRTKLLPCQREMVKWWYNNHGTGIRALARMFNVDKRTIQFVLFPERQRKNVEDRQARGGSAQYYDKEENTKAMREHREHKKKISKIKTPTTMSNETTRHTPNP